VRIPFFERLLPEITGHRAAHDHQRYREHKDTSTNTRSLRMLDNVTAQSPNLHQHSLASANFRLVTIEYP
jgi:hypothetical protein